jgi:hypothetical protein
MKLFMGRGVDMVVGMKRLAVSLILGWLTCYLISLANYLPFSASRDAISDALAIPGALISYLLLTISLQTDVGIGTWAKIAFVSNVAFYALLWFAFLWYRKKRSKTNSKA